jgi:hypothetical protein
MQALAGALSFVSGFKTLRGWDAPYSLLITHYLLRLLFAQGVSGERMTNDEIPAGMTNDEIPNDERNPKPE